MCKKHSLIIFVLIILVQFTFGWEYTAPWLKFEISYITQALIKQGTWNYFGQHYFPTDIETPDWEIRFYGCLYHPDGTCPKVKFGFGYYNPILNIWNYKTSTVEVNKKDGTFEGKLKIRKSTHYEGCPMVFLFQPYKRAIKNHTYCTFCVHAYPRKLEWDVNRSHRITTGPNTLVEDVIVDDELKLYPTISNGETWGGVDFTPYETGKVKVTIKYMKKILGEWYGPFTEVYTIILKK